MLLFKKGQTLPARAGTAILVCDDGAAILASQVVVEAEAVKPVADVCVDAFYSLIHDIVQLINAGLYIHHCLSYFL